MSTRSGFAKNTAAGAEPPGRPVPHRLIGFSAGSGLTQTGPAWPPVVTDVRMMPPAAGLNRSSTFPTPLFTIDVFSGNVTVNVPPTTALAARTATCGAQFGNVTPPAPPSVTEMVGSVSPLLVVRQPGTPVTPRPLDVSVAVTLARLFVAAP